MIVGIFLLLDPWHQRTQQASSLTASLDRALSDPLLVRQIVEVMRKEVPAVYQALIGEESFFILSYISHVIDDPS
jgi:hypothetical protein